jgi:thioredoxin 1
MADSYVEVTDQTFEQVVLKSDKPVVVDFWAVWCGPCRMMAPHFEALAKEYQGRMIFAKLDVDNNERTAARYGIQGIPTLLFFRGGEVVQTLVGARRAEELRRYIDAAIAAAA